MFIYYLEYNPRDDYWKTDKQKSKKQLLVRDTQKVYDIVIKGTKLKLLVNPNAKDLTAKHYRGIITSKKFGAKVYIMPGRFATHHDILTFLKETMKLKIPRVKGEDYDKDIKSFLTIDNIASSKKLFHLGESYLPAMWDMISKKLNEKRLADEAYNDYTNKKESYYSAELGPKWYKEEGPTVLKEYQTIMKKAEGIGLDITYTGMP